MPEELVCTQCGGPLNEDYVCTYCGTHYHKPEAQHVTINVTNNYNAAPMPTPPVQQEQVVQEPPTEQKKEQTNQQVVNEQPESEQEEEQEEKRSSLEQFVNNSFGLLFILLIGAGALIIGGVSTDNDFMLILGIAVGAIFLFLSSHYHKRKDDDSK